MKYKIFTNTAIIHRFGGINLIKFEPGHKGCILYLNRDYGAFMADGAGHDQDLADCAKMAATYEQFVKLYPFATNNSWLRSNINSTQ